MPTAGPAPGEASLQQDLLQQIWLAALGPHPCCTALPVSTCPELPQGGGPEGGGRSPHHARSHRVRWCFHPHVFAAAAPEWPWREQDASLGSWLRVPPRASVGLGARVSPSCTRGLLLLVALMSVCLTITEASRPSPRPPHPLWNSRPSGWAPPPQGFSWGTVRLIQAFSPDELPRVSLADHVLTHESHHTHHTRGTHAASEPCFTGLVPLRCGRAQTPVSCLLPRSGHVGSQHVPS